MTQEQRIGFLIKYLLAESGKEGCCAVPADEREQKRLLRSLMNIRAPGAIDGEFIKIQDEYLKCEIAKRGITDADDLPFAENKISLWQGDITTLKCGAIVNAANSAMLGCFVPCHGCIDNAIHTFSGVGLRLECAKIMEKQGSLEPAGRAKVTKAYNLPCDHIIHTVGPVVDGHLTERHCALLASCYDSCMDIAEQMKIKSVAFPCISTGEFHFPNEKAAKIAVKTVRKRLENSTVERVIFNVFKDNDRRIYEGILG